MLRSMLAVFAVILFACTVSGYSAHTANVARDTGIVAHSALTAQLGGAMAMAVLAIYYWRRSRTDADIKPWPAIDERTGAEPRCARARAEPASGIGAADPMRRRVPPETARAEWRNVATTAASSGRLINDLLARTHTATVLLSSDATILDASDVLPRLLGRSRAIELVGGQLGSVLNMEDYEATRHFCSEALRLGQFALDLEARIPGHRSVWIEANGTASVLSGQPCVIALLRDVSARKAAEEKLTRSCENLSEALEAARNANGTNSAFLAKVNHELRTPLNGIMGFSEMLRHISSDRAVPGVEIRRFCDNIHRSGTHLLSLVDDLLDLSRLESGNWVLDPTVADLRADIDMAIGTLSSAAPKKRVVIENACPPGTEWVVDRRALRQVVINLAGNAMKFSPPDGLVRIAVTASPLEVALQVIDQGPGVPDDERERILKPFGRGSYALNQRIDGIGLGLSIVSELMALHGGRLAIESEPGRGSTFAAVFPSPARPFARLAAE